MERCTCHSRRSILRASLGLSAAAVTAVATHDRTHAAPAPISAQPAFAGQAGQLSFDKQIITPQGTPLGGNVHVDLYPDGRTYVKFHLHTSSVFADYDFNVRAYVSAPGCPTIAFLHSGNISGVDDNDHEEWGNNPLVALYWSSYESGAQYSVAKDYSWGGIIGGVQSLVDDLLDLGAGALGATLGGIVGGTREALDFLGLDLGTGGTFGVISGVVVFAVGVATGVGIGASLVTATITGVEVGAVLESMIEERPLNDGEIAVGQSVFGNTIPYDKIRLTNLAGMGGRAFTIPGVDGLTYINLGSNYDNPMMDDRGHYTGVGQLLIHELTHAWQIEHATFIPGLLCSMVVNQERNTFGDSVYKYDGPGPNWGDFNAEQQGSIVDQWFAATDKQSRFRPMDQGSPYYRYIWYDVLNRQLPIGAPGNIRSSSSEALSRAPGLLDVFYPTRDGSTGSVFWNQAGGWAAPFTVSGFQSQTQAAVSAISRYKDHLDLFWVTPNGEIGTNWWDPANTDGPGGWGSAYVITTPGSAAPLPVAACTRFPMHMDVFWVAPDQSIWTTWWEDNSTWATPKSLVGPGSAAGALTAVARNPGHVDLYWVTPDGSVWGLAWDENANAQNWQDPYGIAGAGSAKPTTIAASCRNPEHVDLFWIAHDGSVGTNWWDATANNGLWNQPFTIAGPGSAANAIATACRFPDQVDVYYVAPDGSIGTAWWAADPGWNAPFSLTPGGVADTLSPISVVNQSPASVDVFWHTPDGALGTVYWYDGGGGWADWFAITAPETIAAGATSRNLRLASTEAVSQWPGHLDVFYPTPDGSVGSVWWDQVATWSGAFLVAGPTSSCGASIASVSRYGGHLDTFYVAPDGSIATAWWQAGANDGAWPGPYTIWGPGTAATPATIAATSDVPWRLHLFWLTPGNAVGNTNWDSASGTLDWSAPASISVSGGATNAITAIGRKPGHLDVFWVTTDGSVNTTWMDTGQSGGAWAAEFSIAGPGSAMPTSIVAIGQLAEHIDVFWVTPDGSIMSTWWDSVQTWTAPFTIAGPGSSAGAISAISREPGQLDVFWITPDGAIWTAWWRTGGNWNAPYPMTDPGMAAGGSPISATNQSPTHMDVFWHTPDGAIGTTYWDASVVGWGAAYSINPAGNVAVSATEADDGTGTTPPPNSPTRPRDGG